MTLSAQYAKALRDLVAKKPAAGQEYARNLGLALKRRGHQRLAPLILAEYKKLEVAAQRSEQYKKITPSARQTQVLLDLYQKLIAAQ